MATRTPVITYNTDSAGQRNGCTVTWSGLLNGDDGAPWSHADYGDRSVQFQGTFGAGGTIVAQGSNDGTNYQSVTDPQGNAISKTAAALEAISENTRLVRPAVTAGDGTTSLVCTLYARRNR